MTKEIRIAQGRYPVPESHQYSDELAAKEMIKKFPKSEAKKREETLKEGALNAIKKRISIAKRKHQKISSKRTTPGLVPSESPPAHIHAEGRRWIKNLIKQNLSERTLIAHKGSRGGRKK
jgi:hypothetical protein